MKLLALGAIGASEPDHVDAQSPDGIYIRVYGNGTEQTNIRYEQAENAFWALVPDSRARSHKMYVWAEERPGIKTGYRYRRVEA